MLEKYHIHFSKDQNINSDYGPPLPPPPKPTGLSGRFLRRRSSDMDLDEDLSPILTGSDRYKDRTAFLDQIEKEYLS